MLFYGYTRGMETLPQLLSDAIADATVLETVDIGGGDVVAVTTEATHVYRSDGLLSDESTERFGHDAERLSVRSKRRKTEIRLETIDGGESFTVPAKVSDAIVEALLEGLLRTTDVVAPDEELVAQFRFSELTLVVTDECLLQHVGSAVWDEEFETIAYGELVGLDFERGSVATQLVIETGDRRRRVKVPNEQAGQVRRAIQDAVFAFHGVSSLEALREKLAPEDDESGETGPEPDGTNGQRSAETTADSETEPEPSQESEVSDPEADEGGFVTADWTPPADQDVTASGSRRATTRSEAADPDTPDAAATGSATERPGAPDVAELATRVETLSKQVERQTELLESQRELIDQLVDELRRGR